MKQTVKITVEGGVVQEVETPANVDVLIYDYDVDSDDEFVEKDENGFPCLITRWSANE
jgi:hypothetical protein